MGRAFDAIQTCGVPVTSTKREVRSMSNEYSEYPPLDSTGHRDGYTMRVRK